MDDERQQDIKEIATRMLGDTKKRFNLTNGTNDTVPGRMVYQLEWILRTQADGNLRLPIEDAGMIGTLRHAWMEYRGNVVPEIDGMKLLSLIWDGNYLMKPPYYHYAIKEIDEMLELLKANYAEVWGSVIRARDRAPYPRIKAELERMLIDENAAPDRDGVSAFPLCADFRKMRSELESKTMVMPMMPPDRERRYPSFDAAYSHSLFRENLKNIYIKNCRIEALIVNGVRPGPDGRIRQAEGWGK